MIRQHAFALAAEIRPGHCVKVKEHAAACTPSRAVYSVWTRAPGAKRGRAFCSLIFTVQE
jgi:hypothetical protein